MKFSVLVLFSLTTYYSIGQTPQVAQKIGHADWTYIFGRLPEYAMIEKELKSFETQLQNQLTAKNQELEAKFKIFQSMPGDTPEAIRKDKESELVYLQENIQKFQQDAQKSMTQKQTDLVSPVFAKVGKAIEEVALENGFAYIINPQMVGGGDVLLFTDEKYNISELVLKRLGIDTVPAKK